MRSGAFFILFLAFSSPLSAAPTVGKGAAMKYFKPQSSSSKERLPRGVQTYTRQLALSAGTYFKGKSYEWLGEDVGGWSLQLDYRKKGTADSFFSKSYQVELQRYQFSEAELSKFSFLWSLIFPRSLSFPVYVGVGLGPGVFLSQLQNESWLSLDYKAFLGFRLSDDHSQFFVEGGVKNHLLVLSSGQFTGWFVSSGVAYRF